MDNGQKTVDITFAFTFYYDNHVLLDCSTYGMPDNTIDNQRHL